MGKSSGLSGKKNIPGPTISSPALSPKNINEKDISTSEAFKKLERQNEILLFICEKTARIRSKNDMCHFIQDTIKQYIPFDDSLILRYNKNTRTARIYIYHAEKHELENPEFIDQLSYEYPVENDNIDAATFPVVRDAALLLKTYQDNASFIDLEKVKEYVCVKLIAGDQLIGFLLLFSEQKNLLKPNDLNLLQRISYQISIATANTIANEEIEKREEERTILLSFSNEIAAIKSRSDFFEVVNSQLKILFGIKEFGIAQIDPDGLTYDAFLLELGNKVKGHADYEKVTGGSYLVSDPVFSMIMNSENPLQLDVNLLSKETGVPAYVEFWKNVGLTYVFGVALRVGGINVGCAFLHVDKNHTIDIKNKLLNSVCAQIAEKVSNILANEEIGKREEEKTILLSFSNEIADIKSRNDLFEVVIGKIKNIFGIERFSIAKINEDGATFSAFTLDASGNEKDLPDYDEIISADYPFTGGVFGNAMTLEEPVLFDINQLDDGPERPAYIRYWKRMGFRYVLIVALRTGGKDIGFALLYFNSKDRIDTKSSLLKGICAQLSVKVSNILSYEEIAKREEEKTILLAFSNEIAGIRNREDFYGIVISRVKKILAIERFAIANINEDGTTLTSFVLAPSPETKRLPGFNSVAYSNYPLKGWVFGGALISDGPALFDLNEFPEEPGTPAYIGFWKTMGVRYVLIIVLRKGGRPIGFAILYLNSKRQIDIKNTLLNGVCAQLGVIVSNILASEEIEKREHEKSMLLAFSNAIASERDKNKIAKILKQQLKVLFNIDDYTIHALSDDKKNHTPMLYDLDADFASHPDFVKLLDHWTDVNDGVYNITLAADGPVTFNAGEWSDSETPPPYANAAKAVGLNWMTGVALRLGQENIGLLNFRQNDLNQHAIQAGLFKSICSQIAITLANIIANEKVSKQLKEINKYKEQLEEEKIYLKEEIETSQGYTEIVGDSPEIKKVFRLIAQVAYSDSTVLLLGETGTGKELIARAIHNLSARKNKLMVKVNCAALPANLIESELFGHERGSFTGATERRIGKFELANNGTLFLDEIGEMPLDLQVKLLRALQEKEIERVGGRTTIKTDARIIAATNRDLEKLMDEGKFRLDLYYRLNIFPIMVPPLRSRSEDIPKLALYFIERYSKKTGKKIKSISNKALQELMRYDWPGNIRELEHLIERGVLLATGDSINEIHLPHHAKTLANAPDDKDDVAIKTIDENERDYIIKILKYVKGRIGGKGGAAELLGLPTSTLNSRIKKLGIRREHI